MPRPMLKNESKTQTNTNNILSATQISGKSDVKTQTIDKMKLDRMLRKSRSKEYMEAMKKLDAGGHAHNQNEVNEIIETLENEFPEIELKGILKGIVAKCYLGDSYEVHTLSITGYIIQHYKRGEGLPGRLEQARSLAARGCYAFIEVYDDCFRAVSDNGTVSVIV